MDSLKKYVAEFFGTFTLVLVGCGTAMTVGCDSDNGCGYILTAFAFGLVIVGMAYCIGNVSGCHINPAVSLACLLSKRMSGKDFLFYCISPLKPPRPLDPRPPVLSSTSPKLQMHLKTAAPARAPTTCEMQ